MEAMSLDERVFRAHLERGSFQSGVDRGRWRLVSIYWPYAVFTVGATARQNAPTEYAFRFELNNYPASPPTAQPWDINGNAPLPGQRWSQSLMTGLLQSPTHFGQRCKANGV